MATGDKVFADVKQLNLSISVIGLWGRNRKVKRAFHSVWYRPAEHGEFTVEDAKDAVRELAESIKAKVGKCRFIVRQDASTLSTYTGIDGRPFQMRGVTITIGFSNPILLDVEY